MARFVAGREPDETPVHVRGDLGAYNKMQLKN